MRTLRGSGSTFSTSGKRWRPFAGLNPKIARRNAKARRLLASGLIKPLSKAEARSEAERLIAVANAKHKA